MKIEKNVNWVLLMEDDVTLEFLTKLMFQGESIEAEIVRLAGYVPKEFVNPEKTRFQNVLIDFKYFEKLEQYEKELTKETRLQSLFYSTFGSVFIAFEQLFVSIAEFLQSFQKYIKELTILREEAVNSQILELEINCIYHCGLILLYLEKFVAGPVRERLYVAIYRKSDEKYQAEFLVDFLKSETQKNGLIRRFEIPKEFVRSCISNIELMVNGRGIEKSALMFIALQFEPTILAQDSAKINKIVNSIYREKWAFNLGFGMIINLFDAWHSYKAAWNAVNSIITSEEGYRLADSHLNEMKSLKLPKNVGSLMSIDENLKIIRRWNRNLKWLILHSRPSNRGKGLIYNIEDNQLFEWIIEIAEFETKFLENYRKIIKNRTKIGNETKMRIAQMLDQLAEFLKFGFIELNETQKENFIKWISSLSTAIINVDIDEVTTTIETCQQIQKRLKQTGQQLGLATNLTLNVHLNKIFVEIASLSTLVKMKSDEKAESVERKMGDPTYLWVIMDEYLMLFMSRKLISTKSSSFIRQIFTKLGFGVDLLKDRLKIEKKSKRIADTWSCLLEKILRKTLQSVPEHLIEMLWTTIVPNLESTEKLGIYLEKERIEHIDKTFRDSNLAKATHSMTNMSLGITRMMLRKVGTLKINPKQLLEDGIIRQIYKEIKRIMKNFKTTNGKIENAINNCEQIETLRLAFIYMCEFMNLDGNAMWNAALDDYFCRIGDEPEPHEPLAEMVIEATNPKATRYFEDQMVWKDLKKQNSKVVFTFDFFAQIEKMIPYYALSTIESIFLVDLENLLKQHLIEWRKISIETNAKWIQEKAEENVAVTSSAEYEKMLKNVQTKSLNLCYQLAQIGQLVLILSGLAETKKNVNELRDDQLQKELQILSRLLVDAHENLPESTPTLLQLFQIFSMVTVDRLKFELKDELAAILMLALIQCVATKIGDAHFVCPRQLEIGMRFVLKQAAKNWKKTQQIVANETQKLLRNRKKEWKREAEIARFLSGFQSL